MNEIQYNQGIRCNQVRIVNHDGRAPYIVPLRDALAYARQNQTDLVQISFDKKNQLAVCEFIDIGKYKYRLNKLQPSHHSSDIKEYKFGVNIEEHDIQTKVNNAKESMEKKHPVRIIVFLKKWQEEQKPRAQELFNKLDEMLSKFGTLQHKKINDAGLNSYITAIYHQKSAQ